MDANGLAGLPARAKDELCGCFAKGELDLDLFLDVLRQHGIEPLDAANERSVDRLIGEVGEEWWQRRLPLVDRPEWSQSNRDVRGARTSSPAGQSAE